MLRLGLTNTVFLTRFRFMQGNELHLFWECFLKSMCQCGSCRYFFCSDVCFNVMRMFTTCLTKFWDLSPGDWLQTVFVSAAGGCLIPFTCAQEGTGSLCPHYPRHAFLWVLTHVQPILPWPLHLCPSAWSALPPDTPSFRSLIKCPQRGIPVCRGHSQPSVFLPRALWHCSVHMVEDSCYFMQSP